MTKLSPLEELLFRAWANANGVDNHDDPKNQFDHRGLFKQSNGLIQPVGVVKALADSHNKAYEAMQQEGGDTINPDPYMAQAEMHKANLDSQSKQRSDMMKAQMEKEKMAHTSQEKEKDRQHKMQLEQLKLQHKAQQEQMKAQMQAQQQQQQMAQQAQMAEQDRAANMQQADADRQVQVQQGEADRQATAQQTSEDRQFQMQNSQADRQHEMAVTDKQAAMKPVSAPKPQNPNAPQGGGGQSKGSGLQDQLMQRAIR